MDEDEGAPAKRTKGVLTAGKAQSEVRTFVKRWMGGGGRALTKGVLTAGKAQLGVHVCMRLQMGHACY